jgi:hypothetical protein
MKVKINNVTCEELKAYSIDEQKIQHINNAGNTFEVLSIVDNKVNVTKICKYVFLESLCTIIEEPQDYQPKFKDIDFNAWYKTANKKNEWEEGLHKITSYGITLDYKYGTVSDYFKYIRKATQQEIEDIDK